MSRKVLDLNPEFRPIVGQFLCNCLDKDLIVSITETNRTFVRQDVLWRKGRIDKSSKIVTNAMAGWSFHNYGYAFDVAIRNLKNGELLWDTSIDLDRDSVPEWEEVGDAAARILELEWSGDWKNSFERCHFQYKGISLIELQKRNFVGLVNYVRHSGELYPYHLQTYLKKMQRYEGAIDGILGKLSQKALKSLNLIDHSGDFANVLVTYFNKG